MTGSSETHPTPAAMLMRRGSHPNSRIPPIARRSSSPMPCRMAMMSRDKLQKEAGAKSPDLRRCLGHQRLLRRSIKVAQKDARKAMAACQLEDSSDSDSDDESYFYEESSVSPIREQITSVVKAMVKRRTSQPREAERKIEPEEPVNMVRIASKSDNTRDVAPQEPARHDLFLHKTSSATSLISTRGRRYASKLNFGRRFWSPSSHAVQAIAT